MKRNWQLETNVTVSIRRDGLLVARKRMHNLITTTGLSLARDAILGDASLKIMQCGLGAGNAAPNIADTSLEDERVRAEIVIRDTVGADTALTVAYVAPDVANTFEIEEIGWFGGAATSSIETGILVSRVLYNHTKNSLESIQIDRQDTFSSV